MGFTYFYNDSIYLKLSSLIFNWLNLVNGNPSDKSHQNDTEFDVFLKNEIDLIKFLSFIKSRHLII